MARILIIEDDVLVARMYQKVFSFEGMSVEIANDGLEGVEKARVLKPDLIVCDVMMPRMNGLEVLDNLKSDPETKDIPVIMLTNLSGTQDAEKALSRGAISYMVKSKYKPREIAQEVKRELPGQKVDEQTGGGQ